MANSLEKVPPQSIDAEMALIGAMLIERDAVIKALDLVKEEDFYREVHKLIFGAIREISDTQSVEIVTVNERLKNNKMYIEAGGSRYLAGLIDKVKTAANVEYYADIIKDKSILRQIVNIGSKMVTDAFEEKKPSVEILDQSQENLFNISKQNITSDFETPKQLMKKTVAELEKLHQDKRDVSGLKTGFDDLDKLTSGLQPSELIILAGRPSMGKTAFALNIAENVAINNKGTVAIFSLEMSKESLMKRFLASCALVNGLKLRSGQFSSDDWTKLTNAAEKLVNSQIHILDKSDITITELRAASRKLARKLETKGKKLDLIIIDYLQLIGTSSKYKSESEASLIAEVSRSLKAIARDLQIPVLVLSQLSRENEKRTGSKKPQLSDLRGSGAIEQDADVVAFVHREIYYDKDKENQDEDKKREAQIIVSKQRNGPVGNVNLVFESEFTKFFNKSPMEDYK
ncbi:replicative DNA helicase [Candidatus Ruminimicrobium bovinum]|uniref:replicative DNA helicase n=1 Tax=Candidatus Ruminimicrobium bovinum TaxID=3242779 RepID=UPI0039B89BFD